MPFYQISWRTPWKTAEQRFDINHRHEIWVRARDEHNAECFVLARGRVEDMLIDRMQAEINPQILWMDGANGAEQFKLALESQVVEDNS